MLPEHLESLLTLGANAYLASVAKDSTEIEHAFNHYSEISAKYSIPVFMVNSIGQCDNFISAGQTAAWDEKGQILGQLDDQNEGLLMYDSSLNTTTSY